MKDNLQIKFNGSPKPTEWLSETENNYVKIQMGLDLFAKHYNALWD